MPQTSACLTKGPCASVMCSARQGEQSCLRLRSVLHHGKFSRSYHIAVGMPSSLQQLADTLQAPQT